MKILTHPTLVSLHIGTDIDTKTCEYTKCPTCMHPSTQCYRGPCLAYTALASENKQIHKQKKVILAEVPCHMRKVIVYFLIYNQGSHTGEFHVFILANTQ